MDRRTSPAAAAATVRYDHTLDGLRLVASLLVIAVHVCAQGFAQLGRHWWAINAYDSVARVAVPLFFMVSGALLLPRVHDVASIWRRLWRILVPLAGWSALYLAWFRLGGQTHDDWPALIVAGPVVGHLWYLYALAGLYVFLPVAAAFYRGNPVRVQLFCLVFWFIGASVVPLEIALTGRVTVGIGWGHLPLYAGYMACGALLYHRMPALPRRRALVPLLTVAWVALALATAVATWWRCNVLARADETFYTYSSPLVLLAALCAFVSIRAAFARWVPEGGKAHGFIRWFAGVSFGVYLIHVWLLFLLEGHGFNYRFINPWLAIPLLTVATAAIAALLVRAMQAVPLLRAIVPR